jgi:hypothetical protein
LAISVLAAVIAYAAINQTTFLSALAARGKKICLLCGQSYSVNLQRTKNNNHGKKP